MQATDFSVHSARRAALVERVKAQQPNKKGLIIVFAGFEIGSGAFRQDSSFYYLTGIREPGVVLVMDLNGAVDLYIPNCDEERAKWIAADVPLTKANAKQLGLRAIGYLGDRCVGYQFHPFFPQQEYSYLLKLIGSTLDQGGVIFTLNPDSPDEYVQQRLIISRLHTFLPELNAQHIVDISDEVAALRRKKDMGEIGLMFKAVEITALAHEAAARTIADGARECEVQASLEYIFVGSGARCAFASIVGAGKNSTVLHYFQNQEIMRDGDLVVVDIGAEYEYYCADLTRTYPVSGTFTPRQKEIYNLVLETQAYIASIAKPGMWLSNKEQPDQSLNHLARKYLQDRGYGKYFPHGIGHFLGLDVHDVGNSSKQLEEGDVITIEPGIYIPEEKIGVRIEDDYWVVKDGVVCLSEELPKRAEEIEEMLQLNPITDHHEQQEHH